MGRLFATGVEPVCFEFWGDDGPVGIDEFVAVEKSPRDVGDGFPVRIDRGVMLCYPC